MEKLKATGGKEFALLLVVLVLALSLAAATPALAAGGGYTTSSRFPIDLFVFVPCAAGGAGESVELTGTLHDLFHVTFDANGGYAFTYLDDPQGVSGTGLTSGDKYQATGETSGSYIGTAGGTSVDIYVNNFRIIGQGPGNNFLVHEDFHVTVKPDGTVTSYHDNFRVECK